MDHYCYFRDHDGESGWGVAGPNNFRMTTPTLGKTDALIIAKLLSKQYQETLDILIDMKKYDFHGLFGQGE